MTSGRFKQARQGLRPAASTLVRCRNDLAQQQRNIMEKIDARAVLHPGAMQTSFTTDSGSRRRERTA